MHILACPPYPVAKLGQLIPIKFIERLEQDQKIASCCRHPEYHTLEAWYSSEADRDKGVPDIYIFTCTCGRKHRRFCVGGSSRPDGTVDPENVRPTWEIH